MILFGKGLLRFSCFTRHSVLIFCHGCLFYCNFNYETEMHRARGSGLDPWPQRLTAASPRLEELGVSPEEFLEDTVSF